MIEEQKKQDSYIFWTLFMIMTFASSYAILFFRQDNSERILRIYGLVLVFVFGLRMLLYTQKTFELERQKGRFYFLAGYGISIAFLVANTKFPVFYFWMIGSVLLARKISARAGIALQLVLTFLYCSIFQLKMDDFIACLILGGLLCVLIRYVNRIVSFLYVSVIVMSVEIMLFLVLRGFSTEGIYSRRNLFQLLSGAVIVLLVSRLRLGEETVEIPPQEDEEPQEQQEEQQEEQPEEKLVTEPEDLYIGLVNSDAPMMKEMFEQKPRLYKHALLIGLLAERAAKTIGADPLLSKAGGMYHEIGRLREGDYIENGIAIAKEGKLPEALISILMQQNGKKEHPKSKEAAIVLLTDSIVHTIRYFEKQSVEKRKKNDTIIKDIFRIRLEEGILDEAGLSLQDYQALREFYLGNLPNE
ncbi:MAG: cyclic-di-AMP phosphodiesterase PgpH [Clostridiales bacterium]|nr:cyclic-di-AMP phosphodiesterase PgpH [Clostridiales bacterium]